MHSKTQRVWMAVAIAVVTSASLAAPMPSQAAPPPARAAAVVGAQTSGDSLFPHQGNGGYDVSHYDIDVSWAASGAITATTTIIASAPVALSEFSFDLEGLTVSAVTVNGAPAKSFSRVATAPTFKLVVTPATPVGGTFTTVVTYAGTPTAHTDADGSSEGWNATAGNEGAVALNEPVGAMTFFPNNNTPADKATYTTEITVPAATIPIPGVPVGGVKKAVSNGVLTSTTLNPDGTTSYLWTQAKQQASYLVLIGIGNYTVTESDVALTTGTTHEWTYADPTTTAANNLAARRGELSAVLRDLESHYGTYPGVSTGLVVDTVPAGINYALETQDRPFFPSSIDQETMIHELVHQWFGDAVSPVDWSDVWLNEGPATFIATQVTHDLYAGATTEDTYYDLWNKTAANSALWKTPVAGFKDPADLFGWQVYNRGAMVLEALRSAVGTASFTKIMSTYIARFGGGDASTADFTALAEEISGKELTAFFKDWIYDTDKPAWPATWNLAVTSTPVTGTTVNAGDHVAYALSAANTGKVALANGVVKVDVADLIAGGTLDALPATVSRSGTILTWTVPSTATAATSKVTIGATLDHLTSSDPLVVTATSAPTSLGATCLVCASTLPVRLDVIAPSPVPTVGGVLRTDQLLTATVGSWDPQATLAYQWLRDGNQIPGATGLTYRLTRFDVGARMSFAVTGSRPAYADVTRVSAPTSPVGLGVQAKRPRPTITGTAQIGRTLRGLAGAHDSGVTITYRWYAGTKPIAGAASSSYKISRTQAGKRLSVRTTATKPGYLKVVRTSLATKPVAK